MAFGGAPPPPFDPRDPKALIASANRDHQNNVGITQDVGHVFGWVWAGIRWPFRLVSRVIRRS